MSFLEYNRRILEERFGSLETLFSDTADPEEWETGTSRSGAPWARFRDRSLCSRHAPEKEAERLVSQDISSYGTLCLFGFGLGYTAEAWLKKNPQGKLILLEASRKLFLAAMKTRDLSWLLNHKGLYLVVESPPENLSALLKNLQLTACQVIRHRALYPLFEREYRPLEEALTRWLNRKEVNRNTLRRFGTLWIRNFAANLEVLNQARPVEELIDRFKGVPAVICGAGPGLEEQLPVLKETQGNLLIIAVDTAYRTLLRWGIKPQFLLITDPQYWNSRHLDFCDSREILVSDSSTHPRVFRNHRGPVYLSSSPFPLAKPFEERKFTRKLRSGGSVATAAWDLALQMGCSPVYLAGMDLSYPGQQSHCRGSYFEERCLYLSRRLCGVEQFAWNAVHSAPVQMRPSQIPGQWVRSDQRMAVYLDWFSENSPGTDSRNLSTSGARIEGMPSASVDELVGGGDFSRQISKSLEALYREESEPGEEIDPILDEVLESLDRCLTASLKGQDSSSRLKEAFYRGEDLQPILEELNRCDQELHDLTAREIGGFLMEPFLEEILARQEVQDPEAILNNTRKLYRNMSDSLKYHLKFLGRSREI